jgi:hypothetical protein
MFELNAQAVYDLKPGPEHISVFFGPGGALGFLYNFRRDVSSLVDLKLLVATGYGNYSAFYVGAASNQSLVFRMGKRPRFIMGFGVSETIRTLSTNPFVFGIIIKIGFEKFEKQAYQF